MNRRVFFLASAVILFYGSTAFAVTSDDDVNTKVIWESTKAQTSAVVSSTHTLAESTTLFFLFTGIIASAFAAVILVRSGKKEVAPADEYAIIEDIIEGVDD